MTFKVLIAVDGSIHSEYAVEWYKAHIHDTEYSVVLAHVGEPEVNPSFGFRAGIAIPREQWDLMIKEQEAKVKNLLKKHSDHLKAGGVEHIKCVAESGNAGVRLIEIAEKNKVQMIAIGTRGQGTVARTVLGSVSDYVLHHSSVPVCIIHTPDVKSRSRSGSKVKDSTQM
ncbi:hypothetical protein CAPTEDRAFT_21340 [Capitella teleta]|uniref:UspA domain-containing protein n=1 Tax=Capitella teleta TaxID=283909 RepID=R7TWF6_CAPTE|nr:hypothetical protein CAPTEDRAFT_21340 [Capitella teleta]|eukprot:ELT95771.1 hypothetical protein CAPTEDRAFT_21340 [Capitella teleta]